MVHQVKLFKCTGYVGSIGSHFGISIKCEDGWYCFEYAAGGASGSSGSSQTTNKVTVNRYDPPGQTEHIGDTKKSLEDVIDFARTKSGFHNSKYDLTANNCRQFCHSMAQFMGVETEYFKKSFWFAAALKY